MTLVALLFTIVVMFSFKGGLIVRLPVDVLRITVPTHALLSGDVLHHVLRRAGPPRGRDLRAERHGLAHRREQRLRARHPVAVAVFGITSPQAFATVIGPLVEVPVLIGLVNVALFLQRRFYTRT